MSAENVEVFRRAFEALQLGDNAEVERLLKARIAPEFIFHPLYLDRTYRGYEGMWELWSDLAEFWEEYRFEVERIDDLGDHILVHAHVSGRGPGSGVPIDDRLAMLLAFRGEQAIWGRTFRSEREAREAADAPDGR